MYVHLREKGFEHKSRVFFNFLCVFYLKHFYFLEELSEILSYMYIGLHVKYPLFFLSFN